MPLRPPPWWGGLAIEGAAGEAAAIGGDAGADEDEDTSEDPSNHPNDDVAEDCLPQGAAASAPSEQLEGPPTLTTLQRS
eukprot:1816374-Prorocentrum_lima.AAC.1